MGSVSDIQHIKQTVEDLQGNEANARELTRRLDRCNFILPSLCACLCPVCALFVPCACLVRACVCLCVPVSHAPSTHPGTHTTVESDLPTHLQNVEEQVWGCRWDHLQSQCKQNYFWWTVFIFFYFLIGCVFILFD